MATKIAWVVGTQIAWVVVTQIVCVVAPQIVRVKSTHRDKLTENKLTAKQQFRYMISSLISTRSEGLGKMALGIVEIYLGSPFSANPRCSRSVGSRLVCCNQLSWTQIVWVMLTQSFWSWQLKFFDPNYLGWAHLYTTFLSCL